MSNAITMGIFWHLIGAASAACFYAPFKKVTSRRNNSATCPDFFSNQMKEKDFFLFVVFVFSGRFWLFSSFVYCTVYCKNGL